MRQGSIPRKNRSNVTLDMDRPKLPSTPYCVRMHACSRCRDTRTRSFSKLGVGQNRVLMHMVCTYVYVSSCLLARSLVFSLVPFRVSPLLHGLGMQIWPSCVGLGLSASLQAPVVQARQSDRQTDRPYAPGSGPGLPHSSQGGACEQRLNSG